MTQFEHDTFIVLDLPEPYATEIRCIRKKYDEGLTAFPAEITVAGSSGVGTLAYDQEPEKVFAVLNEIASRQPPIEARFLGIQRFPNSGLFYLALKDPEPLIQLHARIAASGLKFNVTPFHFTPHCTLAGLSGDEKRAQLIQREVFPQEPFLLGILSVYEVYPETGCFMCYRAVLQGK